MTDDATQSVQPRRQGDVVLEQVRGEVALLKQAVELGAEATKGNLAAVSGQIAVMSQKLDQVIAAQADPAASPGGRVILDKILDLEKDRDDHHNRIKQLEAFTTEARAAYRTLRAQMTIIGFVLGLLSGIAAVLSIMHGPAT